MTRRRYIIMVMVLILLAFLVRRGILAGRTDRGIAVVSVGGGIVAQLPLSFDNTFRYRGTAGPFELAVQENTVRMVSSTCDDGLCVKQGAIRFAGQSISCEANGASVRLDGVINNNMDVIAH